MKKIESACEKFKEIHKNNKKGKFGFLAEWLFFSSNRLAKEGSDKRIKYQRYKRGAIVLVNFGVNLGNELSGNHFAIVLNKDDNPYNGVLTVLPLSSKNKKHYLNLGNSVLDVASNKIIDDCKALVHKVEKKENTITPEPGLTTDIEQMMTVMARYTKLNKETYAMVESVTTVSKYKILKPINKYDPIGKMRVTNQILNIIDLSLMHLFTDLLGYLDDEKLKDKFDKNV